MVCHKKRKGGKRCARRKKVVRKDGKRYYRAGKSGLVKLRGSQNPPPRTALRQRTEVWCRFIFPQTTSTLQRGHAFICPSCFFLLYVRAFLAHLLLVLCAFNPSRLTRLLQFGHFTLVELCRFLLNPRLISPSVCVISLTASTTVRLISLTVRVKSLTECL